jgi:hypothetical protein
VQSADDGPTARNDARLGNGKGSVVGLDTDVVVEPVSYPSAEGALAAADLEHTRGVELVERAPYNVIAQPRPYR